METQETVNYQRIARAIEYINQHFRRQPSLSEVADHVHVSPFHFQRLFTDWAGTTPKKFLQYISLEHAKQILRRDATLFDATMETGLSAPSRLHDLFVKIEGMTPAEYKNGGRNLTIHYSFAESPFGNLIVASTTKGVCHMAFGDDQKMAFDDLVGKFPNATFQQRVDQLQEAALAIFRKDWTGLSTVKLHLKGTDFQLKVWECLLKIPMGRLSTYSEIAKRIGREKAGRAVGTAIGSNPVAFLIPCHRVIQSSGALGGYRWGLTRKSAMIGWESCQ